MLLISAFDLIAQGCKVPGVLFVIDAYFLTSKIHTKHLPHSPLFSLGSHPRLGVVRLYNINIESLLFSFSPLLMRSQR